MENAADALKIAFAMFAFALAIMVTFGLVSQAKSTADTVLYYSDETNFYEQSELIEREVSVAEIIPTLYRYYEESIGVTISLKNSESYKFDLNNSEYLLDENKIILNGKKQFDRKNNLDNFVNEILLDELKDSKFKEEFVEIPISGIYEYGSDGSELVLSAGGKKVYITYTEI